MAHTMYEKLFKQHKNQYGEYPCNDYLNNALRSLLMDDDPYRPTVANAIGEICYCIMKANGKYADDVAKRLAETGLCSYSRF